MRSQTILYRAPFCDLQVDGRKYYRAHGCQLVPIESVHTGYEFDPRLGLNESASVTPAILRSSAFDDVVARDLRDLRPSIKKKLTYQR